MYARKAYGSHRAMSPDTKARNVAASILTHNLPLTPETWQRYGLDSDEKAEQRKRVVTLLLTGIVHSKP